MKGRGAIGLVVAIGALAAPSAAAGAEPIQLLPRGTVYVETADLDGDGDREVVRLVGGAGAGEEGDVAIEAWVHRDGGWQVVHGPRLAPIAVGPVPSRASITGTLLLWREDGRERLLALIGHAADQPQECCISFGEVRLQGDSLVVVPLEGGAGWGHLVRAADLDGDGTDEIVTEAFVAPDRETEVTSPVRRIEILARTSTGFASVLSADEPDPSYDLVVGETDGLPGDEILFAPSEGGLRRIASREGRFEDETVALGPGLSSVGWPVGVAGGRLVLSVLDGVHVLEWPRDGGVREIARLGGMITSATSIVGGGEDALVVVTEGVEFGRAAGGSIHVYDLDLRELATVEPVASAAAVWDEMVRLSSRSVASVVRPVDLWIGTIDGGIEGRPAYAALGVLVQPDGSGGAITRPISPLLGVAPVGHAGPDDGWMVLAGGWWQPPGAATFQMQAVDDPAVAIVSLDRVLAEAEPPIAYELHRAVVYARNATDAGLLAPAEGFEATVTGAPGTYVIAVGVGSAERYVLTEEPLRLDIRPPRTGDDDKDLPFQHRLYATGPDGSAAIVHWEGTFVREPPALSVSASTKTLEPAATIAGRIPWGASVTVDGRPVQVAGISFRVDVEAPLWPRDVEVVARDQVGNETAVHLEVVGFLDYRGLPWTPLLVAATLAAGAFLYLRTPQLHQTGAPVLTDAVLEEIDGDSA